MFSYVPERATTFLDHIFIGAHSVPRIDVEKCDEALYG